MLERVQSIMKTKSITRKFKKIKNAPFWILGVILLFLALVFFTGNKSIINLYTIYQQRNELLIEKEKLEVENKRLQEEIERLQKDMKAIESVAREKYNLKKNSEEIYQVVPEEK